jgi:EPS-associated MarR family transcriptional regulator
MNKPFNHRDQEYTIKVLNALEQNSSATQRELSHSMNLSLGKINYILSSLIQIGYIKAKRFKNSKNKRAYLYILTPDGIRQKAVFMRSFLQRKVQEYEVLRKEIEEIKEKLR